MSVHLQFEGSQEISDGLFALPQAEFAKDILDGLTSTPKHLSSKYFYDERGDAIFQEIMGMEEYYLTRAEHEIFSDQYNDILDTLIYHTDRFQLLEFGAGDGYKTKVLLKHFLDSKANFKYCPIDISDNVLKILSGTLKEELPQLNVEALHGDYFQVLNALQKKGAERKVVMFLGSNIGNFNAANAEVFLKRLGDSLNHGDLLLIGIDLKKKPSVIIDAYNDPKGITRSFNMNLLHRINRELKADFDPESFMHYVNYDPQSGECRSYLISTVAQEVNLGALDKQIQFEAWEEVHMEISKKYSLNEINSLAKKSGFTVLKNLFDSNRYFVDSIWRVD